MTMKEVLTVGLRLIIALLLILLIGALSRTLAMARKPIKQEELSVQDRVDAEQRLWELGYWAGVVDGNFDSASRHALVAFQKVEGRKRTGNLTSDVVFAYEYVSDGKPMYGRIYYLQIDKRTFYSLRFTVTSEKLPAVRDQMDVIARSFRVKQLR